MGTRNAASRSVRAVVVAALVGVVVLAVLLARGGDGGHRVFVTVSEAANVVTGQEVRIGGVGVGEVAGLEPVRRGRSAKIELDLEDRAWPLTSRSRMALRWGGTANYSNRYIALDRGPAGGAQIPEDGVLPSANFDVPVEFDSLLRAFPSDARRRLRRFLDNAGAALAESRRRVRDVLDVSPPVLREASFVLHDLNADQSALRALVRSTDGVLEAVDAAQPDLRVLLSGASSTFDVVARESAALQASIDRAPSTFDRTRTTLGRADKTLVAAKEVLRRLGPGVTEVRGVARPLRRLLAAVQEAGPDAEATLARLAAASPDLNALLRRATRLSPQIGSIGRQAVDNLRCIRPYAPDAMAFFSNWGDFFSVPDGKDKLIRAQVQNYLPAGSNVSTMNSGQAAKAFPALRYGFPRPPGTNAGQPWFLPECGAGPEALDPDKDPEARPFADVMKIPALRAKP